MESLYYPDNKCNFCTLFDLMAFLELKIVQKSENKNQSTFNLKSKQIE